MRMCLRCSGRVWRAAGRQMPQPLSSHEPPPLTTVRPSLVSAVHSKTLPAGSSIPKGLAPSG